MPRKMFSSVFGSIVYDSGIIPANQPASPGTDTVGYLSTAQAYGVAGHDDQLYQDATGQVVKTNGTFMSYDFHDLRDLLEDGQCLSNAMIGIQRMKETPDILACYNVAPGKNIRETIIVTNADVDTAPGRIDALMGLTQVFQAGFTGLRGNQSGKMASQREILYCERRIYAQDLSQTYTSPNQMGSMSDVSATPPLPPTRWLNNWLMIDRTVTGEADLVIGPVLMVLRLIEVLPATRDSQSITTLPPGTGGEALEYVNNECRVMLTFPAFVLNIVGDKRKLTKDEKAIEYSNTFLSNQNDIRN